MANRVRGEVEIEIGEETYTLRYDFNALASIDQRLADAHMPGLLAQFSQGQVNFFALREALWHGLPIQVRRRISVAQLGEMMEPRKLVYYMDKLVEALEAAGFIGRAEEQQDKAGGNRGEAQESTGTNS